MTITAATNIAPLPTLSPVQVKQLKSAPSASQAQPAVKSPPLYATPVYKFDSLANISVELIRDPLTGTVVNQIPAAQVVRKYELGQMGTSSQAQTSRKASSQASPALASGTPTSGAGNVGANLGNGATGATATSGYTGVGGAASTGGVTGARAGGVSISV